MAMVVWPVARAPNLWYEIKYSISYYFRSFYRYFETRRNIWLISGILEKSAARKQNPKEVYAYLCSRTQSLYWKIRNEKVFKNCLSYYSENTFLKSSSNELQRYCLFFHTKSLTPDKFWKIQFVSKSWRRYFQKISQICSSTTIDIFCSYSKGVLIVLEFVEKSQ